jgi:hypothetical protein
MAKATVTADRDLLQELQAKADSLLDSMTAENLEHVLRTRSAILYKIDCIKERLRRKESQGSKQLDYGFSIPFSHQTKL